MVLFDVSRRIKNSGAELTNGNKFRVYEINSSKKKRFAFTLAEVLITLGIIGVVAAMTIPTLITNYRKAVFVSQTKKAYATWTQAFRLMLADEGVGSLTQTSAWNSIATSPVDNVNMPPSQNSEFWSDLSKYIKMSIVNQKGNCDYRINDDKDSRVSDPNNYAIYVNDGTMIKYARFYSPAQEKTTQKCSEIKALGGNLCSYVGEIRIDVNGKSGPNVLGRDVHQFLISETGMLYPRGGKDWALYDYQTDLNSNQTYWKYAGTSTAGQFATGRMVEEGWKMNY